MLNKNTFFNSIFIFFISLLLFVIFFLTWKIIHFRRGKVKGIQYITQIKKSDLIFEDNILKYFYEPKPNTNEVWNPDWLGYTVINKINTDSLNSDHEFSVEKSNQTFRIITLGDSFTFGAFVNTDENFSSLLEKKLGQDFQCNTIKKFEVINLGVGGYDIDYEINRYRKRGIKYNPDLVIWMANIWDFEKLNEYLLPLKEKLKNSKIKTANNKGEFSIDHDAVSYMRNDLTDDYIWSYQEEKFLQMPNFIPGNLLIFGFINWPTNNIPDPNVTRYFLTIKKILSENKNYVFFNPGYNWEQTKYVLPDGHPNSHGHAIIANDLFDYLKVHYFNRC